MLRNKIYDAIDSVTRDDIDKMAQKVFSSKPIYSIVASEDSLKANADYIETLKEI